MAESNRAVRIGSLFSGYGGLDLAAGEVFGGRTAWVSDIEPGPSAILAHRYPGVPNLGDITAVDWSRVEPVDVICGGSPCPDLSVAGRRAGMRPGTRSGLWAAMCDAVEVIRPSFVVWENVHGSLSAPAASAGDLEPRPGRVGDRAGRPALRALGRVLGDLADIGYDAAWRVVRASDVGAPHQRARVFVLAWPTDTDGTRRDGLELVGDQATLTGPERDRAPATDTESIGCDRTRSARDGRPGSTHGRASGPDSPLLKTPTLADEIEHLLPTPTATPYGSNRSASAGAVARPSLHGIAPLLPTPRSADADATMGSPGAARHVAAGNGSLAEVLGVTRFGQYTPAIARWESATGRRAPDPTVPDGKGGRPRLNPRFVEWLMGLPDGWVTDIPGLTRAQALRALGNGVVPAQASHALRMLLAIRAEYWGLAA